LIRRQNAQLVEQNLELDQLMAITAHDLRSPLYGLRNLLDLSAKRGKADGAVPGGTIREAIFSLDSMIALVTRLLDAHSAEHAPLTTVTGEDVRMQLMAAARRIAPTVEAAGVRIDADLSDAPIMAAFDRGALAQILDNLLSNAVRFSPAGGGVKLSCRAQAGRCLIAVEDEGPGFDAAGEAAMFRKFARAPAVAEADGKAGSGMGLFIAATLAERMRASLAFRPAVPTGAIFILSLPID
jgi:signal transduction histidine kinase